MIPRVAQLGTSFTGAGAYYLHDVRRNEDGAIRAGDQFPAGDYYLHDKGGQSAERVAYTETLNLPTRDAEKAMKVMAWTAAHAGDIRQTAVAAAAKAAGLPYDEYVRRVNPFRGRKGSKCVYAYSLAWSPDQAAPSHQAMAAAAKETLKVLGLDSHQAVLVIHTDKAHPHIHVIANRVHPKTGLFADYSRDRLRLSAWAEGYERRTGRILCWERVENNRRRRGGDYVRHDPVPRADHDWWQKHKDMSPEAIRSARDLDQAQDRMLLLAERRAHEAKLKIWTETALAPEIASLRAQIAKQETILTKDRGRTKPAGLFEAVARALKKAAMKVFGREKRARGLLPRLKASLNTVEGRKAAETKRLADWHARAVSSLAARHRIEKARDEERIRRLIKTREARGQGERGRTAFNLRGDQETARHFRKDGQQTNAAEKSFSKRVDPRFYEQVRSHTALDRIARTMGAPGTADASRREHTLSEQTAKRPNAPKAKTQAAGNPDRVSKRLAENDAETKRRSRNRNRARGRRRDRI